MADGVNEGSVASAGSVEVHVEYLRDFAFEFGAAGGDSRPMEEAADAIEMLFEEVEELRSAAEVGARLKAEYAASVLELLKRHGIFPVESK